MKMSHHFGMGVWGCLALLALLLCASANDNQPSITYSGITDKLPAYNAHIDRYYVDARPQASEDETGNLHILYSDKTEISRTLRPRRQITDTYNHVMYEQEGIIDVKVAPDRRTIGWAETINNGGTSYAVPYALAVYQSGKTVLHIEQGQMLWFWMFRDNGKQIAAVWGPTHGKEVGDYQLYDTGTGRLLSEVFGNEATQSLGPDAPDWAKAAERENNSER